MVGELCLRKTAATFHDFPRMKRTLLDLIRTELRLRLDRLMHAAREAHAAATDPSSKAESKYDTRSLEASYLATGQARQVEELAEALRLFETLELPDFSIEDEISYGALVEVDQEGESSWFLLAPSAGGLVIECEGLEVTLLTPESELYGRLLGKRVGEELENPAMMVMEIL
jgi:hypothetical protein